MTQTMNSSVLFVMVLMATILSLAHSFKIPDTYGVDLPPRASPNLPQMFGTKIPKLEDDKFDTSTEDDSENETDDEYQDKSDSDLTEDEAPQNGPTLIPPSHWKGKYDKKYYDPEYWDKVQAKYERRSRAVQAKYERRSRAVNAKRNNSLISFLVQGLVVLLNASPILLLAIACISPFLLIELLFKVVPMAVAGFILYKVAKLVIIEAIISTCRFSAYPLWRAVDEDDDEPPGEPPCGGSGWIQKRSRKNAKHRFTDYADLEVADL